MRNMYLLAAVLFVTGCQTTTTPNQTTTTPNVKGTYHLVGKLKPWHFTKTLEFTTTKVTLDSFIGKLTLDYKEEDGYVFLMTDKGDLRYKQIGADTLVNDTNFGYEGTYARLEE